jgi:hypothetical protein
MASRKPKTSDGQGIDDQIIGGIRAIMSPWLGAPPAQNNKVTQAQGLARGAANMLDQNITGGMIGAGVRGPKALAKQAAINAAALGVGYGVGKVAQKVLPIVQAKLGNEIGVHLSNTDGLRKITYSPEHVMGIGPGRTNVPQPETTFKFSPYRNVKNGVPIGPISNNDLAYKVADFNLDVSQKLERNPQIYAYVTKSKVGVRDPNVRPNIPAYMVPNQRVIGQAKLDDSGFLEFGNPRQETHLTQNTQSILKALLRAKQVTQSNAQTTLNAVRGVAGVATQKTGTKLNNKNKRR